MGTWTEGLLAVPGVILTTLDWCRPSWGSSCFCCCDEDKRAMGTDCCPTKNKTVCRVSPCDGKGTFLRKKGFWVRTSVRTLRVPSVRHLSQLPALVPGDSWAQESSLRASLPGPSVPLPETGSPRKSGTLALTGMAQLVEHSAMH